MKYLVYKASNGLCHMLNTINNVIQFAMQSNRILIIDCNCGWYFKNDFDKYFSIPLLKLNHDYYTKFDYDKLPEKRELCKEKYLGELVFVNQLNFEEGKWTSHDFILTNDLLNSDDDVIICTHTITTTNNWYISLKPEIYKSIGQKIKQPYIGLHYRNTDIKNDLNQLIDNIDKYGINKIYFATDDYNGRNKLDVLLGDKYEILQFTSPPQTELDLNIQLFGVDKHISIINALIDLYHLTNSTHFIPSINGVYRGKIHNSLFSSFVIKNRTENINFF